MTKRFGATVAVADLDPTVGDGEFLVLLGPTGAGKTTTLRLVAGLEKPDAGTHAARRPRRDARAARRRAIPRSCSSSIRSIRTSPSTTISPFRCARRRGASPRQRIRARVDEIARLLHIEDKLANRATQLSGGQMQRVAIGRALVRRPSIYLMDEPLSSLDAKLRAELRVELKRIQRELGATILYVTHDQTEAMTMATHIGVLDQRPAGADRQSARDLRGPGQCLRGRAAGQPGDQSRSARVSVPMSSRRAEAATIGVRTEHVRIRKSANGGAVGRVKWIEHLGDQNHLHVTIADTEVVTLCDRNAGLAVGDAVDVELTAPLFFAAERRTRSRELRTADGSDRAAKADRSGGGRGRSRTPTS